MSIGSFFANPSALGIGLALAFGATWLIAFGPLKWRSPWLWLIFIVGGLLFAPSIAFIQIPLQNLIDSWLVSWLGMETYEYLLLVTGIPSLLLSGLVQEGAKLLPPVACWLRKRRAIDPRLGLSLGAMAGAGFGVFEAQWIHNTILATGWNWGWLQFYGIMALAGFWERFFVVAFHIAATALAGWGLARGFGWQSFLLAAFLHGVLNYSTLLATGGLATAFQVEITIAVFATIVAGAVLWLRWRRTAEDANGSK